MKIYLDNFSFSRSEHFAKRWTHRKTEIVLQFLSQSVEHCGAGQPGGGPSPVPQQELLHRAAHMAGVSRGPGRRQPELSRSTKPFLSWLRSLHIPLRRNHPHGDLRAGRQVKPCIPSNQQQERGVAYCRFVLRQSGLGWVELPHQNQHGTNRLGGNKSELQKLFSNTSHDTLATILARYSRDFQLCGYHQTLQTLTQLLQEKS